jgi:hypothetical protein
MLHGLTEFALCTRIGTVGLLCERECPSPDGFEDKFTFLAHRLTRYHQDREGRVGHHVGDGLEPVHFGHLQVEDQ